MGTRLELQSILEGLLETGNVYFQPPPNVTMNYPAIVYNRDFQSVQFADNGPYSRTLRYQVTVIDPNPDSLILPKVAGLPRTMFVRHFAVDNLNHDVYDVYY